MSARTYAKHFSEWLCRAFDQGGMNVKCPRRGSYRGGGFYFRVFILCLCCCLV